VAEPIPKPLEGEWLLPVGPIHAGVIEPGRFLFRLAGEFIEEVGLRLGYTHKGIERLFQTNHTLDDGWRLAEHVAGDSAFAHSLAYCQAAEALADAHPPREADLLRGLFLELERVANHIGDCAALAHDVAYDIVAMELTALREQMMQLSTRLTGHRFLRGVNYPGGVTLPQPLDVDDVRRVFRDVAPSFAGFASQLAQLPAFRSRLQWMGILSEQEARRLGVTGLAARASGVRRDFRLQHPSGIYRDDAVQRLVEGGLPPAGDSIQAREATAGDALARFLARVREVGSSARIVEYILAQWELLDPALRNEREFSRRIRFKPELNFEFGLGCVEGWRGDVVYWLMQDKFGRIFRCQVRDPSVLNWPGLKVAVDRHPLDRAYRERHKQAPAFAEIILADFPIVNKSFNLSYSGNDR
jgi:Ni,Fe-hydrogenase III large subunit